MRELEFGALFEFIRNGMNVKQDKSGDGLPISRIETISDGTVNPDRVGFAGLRESQCSEWLLQPGDILFSHINSVEHIGKCAVFEGSPEKLVHGMNLLCLRPKSNVVDFGFAKYLIRSQEFRGKVATFINKAVNQASVSIGNLRTIKVSLPPLPEQRRIAAILDQADALRAKRRGALAKLDTLAQSIFVEMFESVNSPKWPIVKLQSISEIVTGYAFKSEEYTESQDGIKLCRGANVLPGRIDWSDLAMWPANRTKEVEDFKLVSGDIVLAMDRPWISEGFKIARVSSHDCPALLVQRVARIRGKSEVGNDFLFGLLNRPAFTRHCRPTETTIPHISPKEIRAFKLRLPPLVLQTAYGQRVSGLCQIREVMQQALVQIDALFSSLQHRAFRGEL